MQTIKKDYKNAYYLSSKEVAKIFNVTEATVRGWAVKGEVIAHKVGKQWFFSRTKVFEWQSIQDTQEILGKEAVELTGGSRYDVFLKGSRVEVKSTALKRRKSKINTGKYWSFKVNKEEDSDFHLFLGYDEKREKLIKAYYVPTKVVYDLKRENTKHLSIPFPSPFFDKFEISKIEVSGELKD